MIIRCGLHNHKLSKNLEDYDILNRIKVNERYFVNDTTKYTMTPWCIVATLKEKDPENITSVIQVYKVRDTYIASRRGPLTEMQMLLTLIHREKYMC